jgi:hypothetical protein
MGRREPKNTANPKKSYIAKERKQEEVADGACSGTIAQYE